MKKIKIPILLFLFSFFISANAEGEEIYVRKPAVAGSFYSDEKVKLSNEVQKYLNQTPKVKIEGEIVALIVPHAGYVFSASVAAYAYKLLEGKPRKTAILIGPSHHYRYDYISIFPRGFYQTPLGQVEINNELAQKFINSSEKVKFNRLAHKFEHSLEVQLPFLQKIWGKEEFTIIPVLLGSRTLQVIQSLKKALLNNLAGENFILIASSDMSHYHNYEEAAAMDKKTLDLIKKFDIQGLYEKIETGQSELCGAGAVLAVMEIAKDLGADKVKILKYANSKETAPPWLRNKDKVVGYSAIAFYREEKPKEAKREEGKLLNKEERKKLLEIARISIECSVEGRKIPEFSGIDENLKKIGGVFVTLNKHGRLRGCIGFPEAVLPIYQAVSQAAGSAAVKDYRFPPLRKDEISDIDIEISVLSSLEKIYDIDKIEIGKHGLVIRKGIFSGLLLPQVAVEYGWNRDEFLERICEKAGLPRGGWKKGANLYIFSAQIFGNGKK